MHLRRATRADLALLTSWDTKPYVIAATGADGAFDWEGELGRDPAWREMLIAEQDRRAIGVLQIIDPAAEDTHYWGEIESGLRAIDIWIGEECDLGWGYGTEMKCIGLDLIGQLSDLGVRLRSSDRFDQQAANTAWCC